MQQELEQFCRDNQGRFSERDIPPCKPIKVYLPEPLIRSLDAYGKKNGTGRGKSLISLLEGILDTPEEPETPDKADKNKVKLELVKTSDPLYKEYRKNHYIPSRGVVGQQLQYLIFYDSKVVGLIGGASAVLRSKDRDEYLGLSTDESIKTKQLNSVINNNIFKLDYGAPNLATIVLKMWRKQIIKDWENLYGVPVAGFETFVVEERLWNGKTRNGACYRADNWHLVGLTSGYGARNPRGRTIRKAKILQSQKLIYCLKVKNKDFCTEYVSTWHDLEKRKDVARRRKEMFSQTR